MTGLNIGPGTLTGAFERALLHLRSRGLSNVEIARAVRDITGRGLTPARISQVLNDGRWLSLYNAVALSRLACTYGSLDLVDVMSPDRGFVTVPIPCSVQVNGSTEDEMRAFFEYIGAASQHEREGLLQEAGRDGRMVIGTAIQYVRELQHKTSRGGRQG